MRDPLISNIKADQAKEDVKVLVSEQWRQLLENAEKAKQKFKKDKASMQAINPESVDRSTTSTEEENEFKEPEWVYLLLPTLKPRSPELFSPVDNMSLENIRALNSPAENKTLLPACATRGAAHSAYQPSLGHIEDKSKHVARVSMHNLGIQNVESERETTLWYNNQPDLSEEKKHRIKAAIDQREPLTMLVALGLTSSKISKFRTDSQNRKYKYWKELCDLWVKDAVLSEVIKYAACVNFKGSLDKTEYNDMKNKISSAFEGIEDIFLEKVDNSGLTADEKTSIKAYLKVKTSSEKRFLGLKEVCSLKYMIYTYLQEINKSQVDLKNYETKQREDNEAYEGLTLDVLQQEFTKKVKESAPGFDFQHELKMVKEEGVQPLGRAKLDNGKSIIQYAIQAYCMATEGERENLLLIIKTLLAHDAVCDSIPDPNRCGPLPLKLLQVLVPHIPAYSEISYTLLFIVSDYIKTHFERNTFDRFFLSREIMLSRASDMTKLAAMVCEGASDLSLYKEVKERHRHLKMGFMGCSVLQNLYHLFLAQVENGGALGVSPSDLVESRGLLAREPQSRMISWRRVTYLFKEWRKKSEQSCEEQALVPMEGRSFENRSYKSFS